MAQHLTSLGDATLANIHTRPLGVDYSFIVLADGFHATLDSSAERLVGEAYRVCRDLLRPLITDAQVWNVEWDDIFSPYGAADWLLRCVLFWDEASEGQQGRLSKGCVAVTVDSDATIVPLEWQITRSGRQSDSSTDWVVSVLSPSRTQRRWLESRAWKSQGNTMWCGFGTPHAAVASLVDALDALAQPNDGAAFKVGLYGVLGEASEAEEWQDLLELDSVIDCSQSPADQMTLWPGTDVSTIQECLYDWLSEEGLSHFDMFGSLTEALTAVASEDGLGKLRTAGFAVTEDGDEDEDLLVVTIYPRSTRVLAV